MNPKTALISCANTFAMLKKWDKAVVEYEKLIAEYGDDPLIYEPLHKCYNGLGNTAMAKLSLERAIRLTPTNKPEKINLLKEKYKTTYGKDFL